MRFSSIKRVSSLLVVISFSFLSSCASSQNTQQRVEPRQNVQSPAVSPSSNSRQNSIIITLPAAPLYWNGDGGKGIKLAVLEPTARGLSEAERWLPSMVQSSIAGDFQRFSAITIVDRQNLERILDEQRLSLSGDFSDEDYVRIGQLTNARYILIGSITNTASAFILELAITDLETGERKASYPPTPVSLFALENLSAIKDATAELLKQLGVNLTEQGRQELNSQANRAFIQAETALARGISAQKQGTIVEALSYYIQASNYDSGLAEATSRMNILTANISSGNIGEDTRTDIAWRRQWITRLQEAETFFANALRDPQPFYTVYSTDIHQGKTDYQKETTDLSVWVGFYPDFAWASQINGVISAVRNGLQATRRAQIWELDWPAKAINTPSPFLNQTKNSSSVVVIEIINDQGRSIGRQTVRVPYGFESKDTVITPLWQWEGDVSFTEVNANLITNRLEIRITSIDGIAAENATRQKKISIMPLTEWREVLQLNPATSRNIEAARLLYRAGELQKQADEHLRTGNFARAITDYTEAIRLNVNDSVSYNSRGQAYLRQGEYNRAIADWEQALRLNPNFTEARRNLEVARQQEQQRQQMEREQQEKDQRQRAQASYDQGIRNLDIRDYNRAITDFTEAIRLNPNLDSAYFQRGRAYLELGRYDSSIYDYNIYIQRNPNSWTAFNNRGNAYNSKKDYDRAIADFTQAIRLNTDFEAAYRNRGWSYLQKENYRMAIADYTEAIRLDPYNAISYNNRGLAYERTGERNRAIADYQAALRLDPNSTLYSNNLRNLRGW